MSVVEPSVGEVPVIADDLYDALIKSVKDVDLETPDQFGNTAKVELQVVFQDNEGEEHELNPRVNRKWGELAALFKIAEAAGLNPNPDAAFDTDYLANRRVRVMVETPEAGKWPRITKWSKTPGKQNGAKPAQAAPKPSQTPAMITALGEVDWTIFWAECGKAGIQKPEVAEELGGDLTLLPNVLAADVVKLFEKLRDKHEGVADAEDLPFEG